MRTAVLVLAMLLVCLPLTAQTSGDKEAVYHLGQCIGLSGLDAVFVTHGEIHVVPVRDIQMRGPDLVVPYPMRSVLPGTGLGVKQIQLVSRGSFDHSAWAGYYAIAAMRLMPGLSLNVYPPPTYISSYTDMRGITHTVTTPQKKFPGKWEKAEDWAARHHEALQALLKYFPPKKG